MKKVKCSIVCTCPPTEVTPGPQGTGIKGISEDTGKMVIELTNGGIYELTMPVEAPILPDNVEIVGYDLIISWDNGDSFTATLPAYPDFSKGPIQENIIGIKPTDNLDTIINAITDFTVKQVIKRYDLFKANKPPIQDFAKEAITKTDVPGELAIIVAANNYTVYGNNIIAEDEKVTLEDDKDSYIYLTNPTIIEAIANVKYGALYNSFATTDPRKITSHDDWRVPTDADFAALSAYLGANIDKILKETGTTFWNSPNNGTNSVNFFGRGAGLRDNLTGTYALLNVLCGYWTTDDDVPGTKFAYEIDHIAGVFAQNTYAYEKGASVKLIRAATAAELLMADGTYCTPYTGNDTYIYKTVLIGPYVMLVENLVETRFRNGDAISLVTDNATWTGLVTPGRCFYNNSKNNAFEFIFPNYSLLSVHSQTTGSPAPIVNGKIIAKVNVTGGMIGTLEQVIKTQPVDGSIIADDSIETAHIKDENVTFEKIEKLAEHHTVIGNATDIMEAISLKQADEGISTTELVFMVYDCIAEEVKAKKLTIGDIEAIKDAILERYALYVHPGTLRPEYCMVVDDIGDPVTVKKGDILFAEDDAGALRTTRFKRLEHPGAGYYLTTTIDGYEWTLIAP